MKYKFVIDFKDSGLQNVVILVLIWPIAVEHILGRDVRDEIECVASD